MARVYLWEVQLRASYASRPALRVQVGATVQATDRASAIEAAKRAVGLDGWSVFDVVSTLRRFAINKGAS